MPTAVGGSLSCVGYGVGWGGGGAHGCGCRLRDLPARHKVSPPPFGACWAMGRLFASAGVALTPMAGTPACACAWCASDRRVAGWGRGFLTEATTDAAMLCMVVSAVPRRQRPCTPMAGTGVRSAGCYGCYWLSWGGVCVWGGSTARAVQWHKCVALCVGGTCATLLALGGACRLGALAHTPGLARPRSPAARCLQANAMESLLHIQPIKSPASPAKAKTLGDLPCRASRWPPPGPSPWP